MTPEQENRFRIIIAEHLGVGIETVTDSASFVNGLGADSLDGIELLIAIEEEFSIEIPDTDIESIVTVADAIRYLSRRLS